MVFEYIFAYNMPVEQRPENRHPSDVWARDARQAGHTPKARLRLAAMAAHLRVDKIAARRAALIDLLADGRPHDREEIWRTVAAQVGEDCWGRLPREALARDLSNLRKGGVRIAYSRLPEIAGYYLQHPRLERPSGWREEPVNWTLVEHIRRLPAVEKNKRAFAAADFALRQKHLVLAVEHPEWSPQRVELEARRIVFGASYGVL